MEKEIERQLFHMLIGLVVIVLLAYQSRTFMIAAVFFTIIIGTVLINSKMLGKKSSVVDWFEKRFERTNAPLPGWGSACYAAGVLIILTVLTDANQMAAAIFMLAVGDGISTLVGRKGRCRLPYNKSKTAEGAVAFFISSLAAYYFIGPAIIPVAFVAAIAETIPLLDDNLMIPIASCAFFVVAG